MFKKKYKEAEKKNLDKNIKSLMTAKPGKAYRTLVKMGSRPGDEMELLTFTLPIHKDNATPTKEAVEEIANFFASISQECPKLSMETLPII